jgi:hypothetical protein
VLVLYRRIRERAAFQLRQRAHTQRSAACRTADSIRALGGRITREPSPIGGLRTKVMKTEDPDGWAIAFVDNSDFLRELCDAKTLKGERCPDSD